ncbi:MAG: molybdate ABC transporter permease subunit [Verrucomicrobia bacterium]|nr:molybdate ABC transporter permease subunit [Verrucomicrobiota bacterium]
MIFRLLIEQRGFRIVAMDLSPIWISLKTAQAASLLAMLLGIHAAWWRNGKDRPSLYWLDAFLMLPVAMPPTVIGLILLFVFGHQSPIGQGLHQLGISIIFTWPAAVIAAAVISFPLAYMTLRAAFKQVDPDMLDSARLDGVSESGLLWRVLIPLARPGVAASLLLCFIRSLGEFGATLMIAGNIPGRTQTIPLAVYFNVEAGNLTAAWIFAGVSFSVSLAVIFFVTRMETNH